MSDYYRIQDHKYSEAEYLFKTIEFEMAKSEEEFDFDFPPSDFADLNYQQQPSSIYSWKFVKRRPRRRYTMSNSTPPAPPSTPTSSTTCAGTHTPSPTATSMTVATSTTSTATTTTSSSSATTSTSTNGDVDSRLGSLLYILDYAPKYKKKLKEQQRTDNELAELFNVITITSSSIGNSSSDAKSGNKSPAERGISAASRTIRKPDSGVKIFKIHRNPKEFFREPDEDSVSAPEYDTDDDVNFRRISRFRPSRRKALRKRRLARFVLQERMEELVDMFDSSISFNNNKT